MYEKAIHDYDDPLNNCVGFIDCTCIQIARPRGLRTFQEAKYFGHMRTHCLIYQTVTTPDGLLVSMYVPEAGSRHVMKLYRDGSRGGVLENVLVIDEKQYCIFWGAASLLRPWNQPAFHRMNAGLAQRVYNKAMSAVREVVEWT